MTLTELDHLFELHQDEYLKFGSVPHKLSNSPDMHAFIMLKDLIPDGERLIAAAEHDEIWLSVTPEMLAQNMNGGQIADLIRCGVRCEGEGLRMFV